MPLHTKIGPIQTKPAPGILGRPFHNLREWLYNEGLDPTRDFVGRYDPNEGTWTFRQVCGADEE